MKKLQRILEEEAPAATAGGRSKINTTRLQRRLLDLSRQNRVFLAAAAAMILVAYGVLVFLSIENRDSVLKATALLASAAGLTWWMVGLWREKAITDSVLVYSEAVPDEVLEALLQVLKKAVKEDLRLAVANPAKRLRLPMPSDSNE